MSMFRIRRQTERVGLRPTLSVVLADKGIVLEEACNQNLYDVGKDYADCKGNTLVKFFLTHIITSLPSRARLPSLPSNLNLSIARTIL